MVSQKKLFVCVAFLVAMTACLSADTIPGGDVSGTWYQANSPYYINGNITLQASDTLTIEPGVLVEFLGGYMFTVQGLLEAIGTGSDSITFTASTVWCGLYMSYAPDTCRLEYCIFENFDFFLSSAVFCSNTNPIISHCRISNNASSDGGGGITLHDTDAQISYCTISGNTGSEGGGILCQMGSPTIFGCTITDNSISGGGVYGGGIAVDGGSNPVIDSCIISYNFARCGGGVAILGGSSCTIMDCRISTDTVLGTGNNNGGGIFINSTGGSLVISGTTIDNCVAEDYGGGLYIENAASVSIIRSIFDGNKGFGEGGILYSVDCGLFIDHCDMVNNRGTLTTGITLNGATDMTLSNCIFRSQEWENINFENYNSASVTYCDFYDWGAGQPFYGNVPAGLGTLVQTNCNGDSCDIYYNILLDPFFEDFPMGDFHLSDSSPCIDAGDPAFSYDPDSTITDMGVYWYIQGAVEEESPRELSPLKLTCSPVPFREQVEIRLLGDWERGRSGAPELKIYDACGRLVKSVKLATSTCQLGTDLKAGIYFVGVGNAPKQKLVKIR